MVPIVEWEINVTVSTGIMRDQSKAPQNPRNITAIWYSVGFKQVAVNCSLIVLRDVHFFQSRWWQTNSACPSLPRRFKDWRNHIHTRQGDFMTEGTTSILAKDISWLKEPHPYSPRKFKEWRNYIHIRQGSLITGGITSNICLKRNARIFIQKASLATLNGHLDQQKENCHSF